MMISCTRTSRGRQLDKKKKISNLLGNRAMTFVVRSPVVAAFSLRLGQQSDWEEDEQKATTPMGSF